MTTQADLQELNAWVNQTPYVAGLGPTEPVDWWTWQPEPGQSFVCRDYVEAKAEALRDGGMDPSQLAVILCWTEPVLPPPNDREYHAVLLVKLGGESWVLDSRFTDIYPWSQPPADYRWDRVQVAGTTEFRPVESTDYA